MSDRRLAIGGGQRRLVLKQERFFPAGTYTWSVPAGCESVDVFLVGGGGGAFQQIYQYKAGGGAGAAGSYSGQDTRGGDGTVLIRYYAYE